MTGSPFEGIHLPHGVRDRAFGFPAWGVLEVLSETG